MSFNLNESKTFINIKLTDIGRRQLSLGRLIFSKAVFSDREVDYNIDRSNYYDISTNRILSPADFHPDTDLFNLDGSEPYSLTNQNITAAKIFTTARTSTVQFFSASTTVGSDYTIVLANQLGRNTIAYGSQTWNTNALVYGSTPTVIAGNLIFVPWLAPQYGTLAVPSSSPILPNDTPFVGLFYRVISADTLTYYVDRPIPRFGGVHNITTYYYPYDGIESYYGSATTQNISLWNLNIVRTKSVAGTDDSTGLISGYTRYGSLQYNGTKHYFGFGNETPAVGFIHFTNSYSGSSTGEQLIEKNVTVHMPMILWHHTQYTNGSGSTYGVSFYDVAGDTYYDNIAKSTYRYLADNRTMSAATIVGKVYHKLKMIVISDQELLTAMSYKSNRNYTYPKPIVELTSSPLYPITTQIATGLCKSDYTYFVTYLPESDSYNSATSFGLPDAIHCGYIQKINGQLDINGNPQFLKVSFPPNSFPYMRDDSNLAGGTGWNANYVQLLVSEQPTSLNYNISDVPATSWKRVSVRSSGGHGVYKATDVGNSTIDPTLLNNYSFVISRQDYESGTTYSLNTGMTMLQNTLNFGSENFFFGIVDACFLRATYKSMISVWASSDELRTSLNSTFDKFLDEDIFVTEVAIFDDKNQLVAVGKPTYPMKKRPNRYLTFQLEIDF